jgi:hypothetical protein
VPQQRSNKAQTPINSDAFNLTPDLATMADSLMVVVPVADTAEGDTVATARAAAGWPVSDARPLIVWDLSTRTIRVKDASGWRGPGGMVRQMHFRATDFAVAGGSVQWDMGPLVNQAGDAINGGFAAQHATSGQLSILETGYYAIQAVSQPNGSPGNASSTILRNGAEIVYEGMTTGYAWSIPTTVTRRRFVANDTLRWTAIATTSRLFTTDVWIYKLDN